MKNLDDRIQPPASPEPIQAKGAGMGMGECICTCDKEHSSTSADLRATTAIGG